MVRFYGFCLCAAIISVNCFCSLLYALALQTTSTILHRSSILTLVQVNNSENLSLTFNTCMLIYTSQFVTHQYYITPQQYIDTSTGQQLSENLSLTFNTCMLIYTSQFVTHQYYITPQQYIDTSTGQQLSENLSLTFNTCMLIYTSQFVTNYNLQFVPTKP